VQVSVKPAICPGKWANALPFPKALHRQNLESAKEQTWARVATTELAMELEPVVSIRTTRRVAAELAMALRLLVPNSAWREPALLHPTKTVRLSPATRLRLRACLNARSTLNVRPVEPVRTVLAAKSLWGLPARATLIANQVFAQTVFVATRPVLAPVLLVGTFPTLGDASPRKKVSKILTAFAPRPMSHLAVSPGFATDKAVALATMQAQFVCKEPVREEASCHRPPATPKAAACWARRSLAHRFPVKTMRAKHNAAPTRIAWHRPPATTVAAESAETGKLALAQHNAVRDSVWTVFVARIVAAANAEAARWQRRQADA